ncbi:MAG: hypothetical protein AAGN35_13415 [Bacteroidota bacterium]
MNTTQNIRKTYRRFIVLPLMLLLTVMMVQAGPGSTNKQKSRLTSKVKKMVENVDASNKATLTGEAVVFFRVNEKGQVMVKGVFGTNDDLIEHVETSLHGELIKMDGLDPEQEYQVKLRYEDLR